MSQNSAIATHTRAASYSSKNEDYARVGEKPAKVISKHYGFSVDGVNFLAPEGLYCELIYEFNISQLPNAPKHMLGLINLRGNLIPLYQIAETKDSKGSKGSRNYAFLIGEAKKGAAILISGKPHLITIDDHTENIPDNTCLPWLEGCIEASYQIQGETWHRIDSDSLFKKLANKL